jgi:molecular chaperone GrpE
MAQDPEPQDPRKPSAEAAAADDAAAAPAPADVDALRRERDEYYDRLLRKTAEFDNYRKRVERERASMVQLVAGDVLETLLPIVDDFERALQAEAGPEAETYRKGVELIYRQLQDLLAKRGVKPVDTVGQAFDPRFHQAITYESRPGHAEGEVIEEVRRGYTLGDRLLRPAMVKVAKA